MITKRKNRYVLIECTESLSDEIMDMFYLSLQSFMGVGGYANANPKIVKTYSEKLFSVRVNRGYEKSLILAVTFCKLMDGRIGFYTLLTSGTMNSIAKKVSSILSGKNKD